MWPLSLSQNTMISNSYHHGDRTRNGRLHGVGITRQSTQWGRTWPVATRHPNPHHGSHHTVNFRQPNTEIPEIYIDGNSSVQPLNNHSLPNSLFSQPHPHSSTLHPSAPRMPNSTNTHSDPQALRAPPTPFVMHHGTYDAAFDPFVMPHTPTNQLTLMNKPSMQPWVAPATCPHQFVLEDSYLHDLQTRIN